MRKFKHSIFPAHIELSLVGNVLLHYTLTRPPERRECMLDLTGHGDLLLAWYVQNWTMYLWWTWCKISVCHFDVKFFVSKMYVTVLLTSNKRDRLQNFLEGFLLGYNAQLGSNEILYFSLLIEDWLIFISSYHLKTRDNKLCSVKGILVHCWCWCKLEQPLQKTVWRIHKKNFFLKTP